MIGVVGMKLVRVEWEGRPNRWLLVVLFEEEKVWGLSCRLLEPL